MNGPSCMYTVRPFNLCNEDVDVPTCMYRMKNIQKSIAFSETLMPCPSISSRTSSSDDKRSRSILEQNPLPEIVSLEGRQEAVLSQLQQLKQQVSLIKDLLKGSQPAMVCTKTECENAKKSFTGLDMVINANPQYPPYSLIAMFNACKQSSRPQMICHIHSSVQEVPNELSLVFQSTEDRDSHHNKNSVITLIWKSVGRDAELVLSPLSNIKIRGEVNILRFLSHLTPQFNYAPNDILMTTRTDAILDTCHSLLWSGTVRERQALIRTLNVNLKNSPFLMGESVTIADVAAWSILKQLAATQELTVNMSKWYQKCTNIFGVAA